MNGPRTEDELRAVLRRRADEVTPALDLAEVQGRARQLRRQSHRRWATGLAAAAVLLIAVPAAVLLTPGQEDSGPAVPGPTPSVVPDKLPKPTQQPSPNQASPSRTSSTDALGALPVGPAPSWSYLHDGQVLLPTGGSAALPGSSGVVAGFAAYKGGWLVADDNRVRLTWYDNQGRPAESGKGGAIAVSADGTRIAYQLGGKIEVGITSGMGEGVQSWPMPGSFDGLVGFARDGVVANASGGDVRLLQFSGGSRRLTGLDVAQASTDAADLVGGRFDDASGGVIDLSTGKTLWREDWTPLAFSPDASLVAAVPAGENGDSSALAILDARTGAVRARTTLATDRIYLTGKVVWEDDAHVLFVADSGPSPRSAILRLGTDDGLERATPVVSGGATTTETQPYVLAAGR